MSSGLTAYYEDGSVTIYHGDCRDVLPCLDLGSVDTGLVDLLLTDPPYGIAYRGRGQHGLMAGDSGELDVEAVLSLALRRLKPNRHMYVFGPIRLDKLTNGATCDLVWDKGKHGSSGNIAIPWANSWERIAFGVWNPYPSQRGVGKGLIRRRRGTVLSYPTVNNGRGALDHPTRKPVALLRELIEASSRHGELVLDPFMGSGATLEAAKLEGRRAIGIEIEERYCELAAQELLQGAFNPEATMPWGKAAEDLG